MPSTARIWDARFAGFRSRSCSCAHATAASTTPMARAPPARRSADCLNTATRLKDGNLMIDAGQMPTLARSARALGARERSDVLVPKRVWRLVRVRACNLPVPIKDAVLHPVPKSTASWWYVFGSAACVLLLANRHRNSARAGLCALRGRGLEQPAVSQSPTHRWAGFCARCTAGDRTSWSPSC